MNANNWDKYGPISGFAMIAIGLAAVLFERAPRTAADFAVNRVALLTQSMLFLIGAAVGLWFLGSLRVHLQSFEGDPGRLSSVAFGAGVAWTTLNMAAQAFQVGVADDPTGAAPTAVLTSMNALFTIANLPLAVTLVAVAIVSFRHRAFPRWQAWLALALPCRIPGVGHGRWALGANRSSETEGFMACTRTPAVSSQRHDHVTTDQLRITRWSRRHAVANTMNTLNTGASFLSGFARPR